jgi:hypothetical protein
VVVSPRPTRHQDSQVEQDLVISRHQAKILQLEDHAGARLPPDLRAAHAVTKPLVQFLQLS